MVHTAPPGCPSSCMQENLDGPGFVVQDRTDEFYNAPCADQELETLRSHPAFASWVSQLKIYSRATGDEVMMEIAEEIAETGCEAASGNYSSQVCRYDNTNLGSAARPFGGLAFFCGTSCCDTSNPSPD
ncbi:unnamed protein product, partial [Effrenium voratum]